MPIVYDGFHRLAKWSINFLHSSRLPDSVIPWSKGEIINRSVVRKKLVNYHVSSIGFICDIMQLGLPMNADQYSTPPDEKFTMFPHCCDAAIYLWS